VRKVDDNIMIPLTGWTEFFFAEEVVRPAAFDSDEGRRNSLDKSPKTKIGSLIIIVVTLFTTIITLHHQNIILAS
jgi:hypothetical protein